MSSDNQFSASEQALGYLYQVRFALLQTLRLPEGSICYIEKDDDVDFTDPEEGKILASLKHKAPGDMLTDLSPDFWKSVRIWFNYYLKSITSSVSVSFYLFTTGHVRTGSFLEVFLPNQDKNIVFTSSVKNILSGSQSKTINKTSELFENFPNDKLNDFFSRITIFDSQERIQKIPELIINERFRPIRQVHRIPVYERLEGWWVNACIDLLTKKRSEPLNGYEISEKLSSISEQFHSDNLPIDFEFCEPEEGVHPETDDRYFVKQLRSIGLKTERIRRAMLDYYRAFQQRASWIRELADLSGELENYDDRLVEEWARLREIIFEDLKDDTPEAVLQETAKKLLNELSTGDRSNLRIRPRVTATFVTMGSYHILANEKIPRVYWHPRFNERVEEILHGGKP